MRRSRNGDGVGTMDMRKIFLLLVLLILISASLPTVWSGRQLLDNSLDDTVTQISLNCGLDPRIIKALVKDLDIYVFKGIVSGSTDTYFKQLFEDMVHWDAFSSSPELKHKLLDCLSKHNILFHGTGEDNPRNRYSERLPSSSDSRRHLADGTMMPPLLAPALAPTLAPAPSLAPTLAPAPALASRPGTGTPSYSPSPSPDATVMSFSPSPPPIKMLPFASQSPAPVKGEVLSPDKHNASKKPVILAVVLTAVGTTAIALLIACCWRCCRKTYGGGKGAIGPKDDRPLLNMSRSDYSGSSCKSGLSSQTDQVGSVCAKTESGLNGHIINLDSSGEHLSSGMLQGVPPSIESSLPPLKLPPGRKVVPPAPPPPAPPPPPPPAPKVKPGPPPPPPKNVVPPRPPQATSSHPKVLRPSPLGPNHSQDADSDADAPKAKLKPLFWDKVSTNPDKSMVWNEIKSGSFQFNEEMIETLFGYRTDDNRKAEGKKGSMLNDPSQYIQLLDPKKSQNLAISLKAMGLKTDEVVEALVEGEELPGELLQTLLKMAPTTDEELKIRLYTGEPSQLGPGEQFIKAIINIPFAFKRMDALLFMTSLPEEDTSMKESFASLEVACKELRSSRLFLKLLEAVLKLGNRMNDGTFRGGAQAFKLDTLLKLSDVKGADGRTTLLHFVVKEIIRSEGTRAVRIAKEGQSNPSLSTDDLNEDPFGNTEDHYQNLGLKVVSCLSTELENVKKAAGLDADALTHTVVSLGKKLVEIKEFLNTDMRSIEENNGFHRLLKSFVEHAEVDITFLLEEEKRIMALVRSTTDYFHGNSGRDEGLRLFVTVRDFLGMIDKACKDVREAQKKVLIAPRNKDNSSLTALAETRQQLFPAIRDQRVDSSSSDDDE